MTKDSVLSGTELALELPVDATTADEETTKPEEEAAKKEHYSESEKRDLKLEEHSTRINVLAFIAIFFFFIYHFFLILGVGMATDTLVSTTGKAALFEVLWYMIKDPWFWKMFLVGFFGVFTFGTIANSNVTTEKDTPGAAKVSRVLTMVFGAIFLGVYYADCGKEWKGLQETVEQFEKEDREYNVHMINAFKARVIFCGFAATLYLISILLVVPLLFSMSGITPFPESEKGEAEGDVEARPDVIENPVRSDGNISVTDTKFSVRQIALSQG